MLAWNDNRLTEHVCARLLSTVPANILEDSEKIVKAVEESFQAQPSAPKGGSDKQLDQLLQLVPN